VARPAARLGGHHGISITRVSPTSPLAEMNWISRPCRGWSRILARMVTTGVSASRGRRIYVVAIALAAAPFVFGLMRAFSSRRDTRVLWMAVAALIGAGLAIAIGKPRSRTPIVVLTRSVAALATSTLLATWTAVQLGATAAPGILAVSFVLGLFSTASQGLALWAVLHGPKSSNSASG
jgi:hypothetical protein